MKQVILIIYLTGKTFTLQILLFAEAKGCQLLRPYYPNAYNKPLSRPIEEGYVLYFSLESMALRVLRPSA